MRIENDDLSQKLSALRQKFAETEVNLKITRMEKQAAEESCKDTLLVCSP